jgi:hypothetical protein
MKNIELLLQNMAVGSSFMPIIGADSAGVTKRAGLQD